MQNVEPSLVDESDPDTVDIFRYLLDRFDQLEGRFDSVQGVEANPASVGAADDAASDPLRVGHYVNYCLLAATDCCRAVVALVRRGDELLLPVVALHPILRSAIESASMAAWILSAPDRRTRIVRRLQAAHDELTHEKALLKSAVLGSSNSAEQKALRENRQIANRQNAYMRAIADANGIALAEYENQLPSWEGIVSQAGATIGMEHDRLVTMWRFASGLTHPSLRRGTLGLKFLQGSEDGRVLSGTLSAKSEWVAAEMAMTRRIVNAALEMWAGSKIRINGERPVPAPELPTFRRR